METGTRDDLGGRLALTTAFSDVPDPRVVGRSKYDLVERLVISVCALVCGIEDFVGIESWSKERIDWLRRVLPALSAGQVVAIDGKASRRSRKQGLPPLHWVSAFATEARLLLGQDACAEKSNELTAMPVLLEFLMLKGVIVTLNTMGTHSHIAQAIFHKETDYVLAVKDNQPKLADSIMDFFEIGQAAGWKNAPHSFVESAEKNYGRLKVRRGWAFSQLDCLAEPQQWPNLKRFGVIEAERTINDKTRIERRRYIGRIAPDAGLLANAVRAYWGIENQVHWCLDVAFKEDQRRAREKNAAANLATRRRFVLNRFRLDTTPKQGSIYNRRILAASSDR